MLLGGRIRYIAGCIEGQSLSGDNYLLKNLEWLRDSLETLGLTVSRNLYNKIIKPIEEELSREPLNDDGFSTISADQAKRLSEKIIILENTVFAEAETHKVAHPIPRRIHLDHLLETPGEILGRGVFDQLSELAKSDLSYSCKCIAFECATAAAFHILRCIEECVRCLHRSYFPRGNQNRAWGALTSELKSKEKNPKPDMVLLNHLDHIRTRFRNPTDHPEKLYEIEESEDLVHLAVDIINRCTRDTQVQKKFKTKI